MPVIREVTLQLRESAPQRGQPRVIRLRVFDQTNLCGGGWHEFRGEDSEGNVRFAFKDPRKSLVLEEFENTLADLATEYEVAERGRSAHG